MPRKKTDQTPDTGTALVLARQCLSKAASNGCGCLNLLFMAMVFTCHHSPRIPLRNFIGMVEEMMPESCVGIGGAGGLAPCQGENTPHNERGDA